MTRFLEERRKQPWGQGRGRRWEKVLEEWEECAERAGSGSLWWNLGTGLWLEGLFPASSCHGVKTPPRVTEGGAPSKGALAFILSLWPLVSSSCGHFPFLGEMGQAEEAHELPLSCSPDHGPTAPPAPFRLASQGFQRQEGENATAWEEFAVRKAFSPNNDREILS